MTENGATIDGAPKAGNDVTEVPNTPNNISRTKDTERELDQVGAERKRTSL